MHSIILLYSFQILQKNQYSRYTIFDCSTHKCETKSCNKCETHKFCTRRAKLREFIVQRFSKEKCQHILELSN